VSDNSKKPKSKKAKRKSRKELEEPAVLREASAGVETEEETSSNEDKKNGL
jgi:hypothetical protein